MKSEVVEDVGYLRITLFNEQTEKGLIDAIKEIQGTSTDRYSSCVI